jgi:hypothetical protein
MAKAAGPDPVEELTITREGDDRMAPRRQLKKQVISTGAWALVAYKFEELKVTKAGEEWIVKYSLVRYRKLKGVFNFKKEFAFSKPEYIRGIADAFSEWLAEEDAEKDTVKDTVKDKKDKDAAS